MIPGDGRVFLLKSKSTIAATPGPKVERYIFDQEVNFGFDHGKFEMCIFLLICMLSTNVIAALLTQKDNTVGGNDGITLVAYPLVCRWCIFIFAGRRHRELLRCTCVTFVLRQCA